MGVPVNFDAAYRTSDESRRYDKTRVCTIRRAQRAVVCLVSAGLSISERLSHLPKEVQIGDQGT